MRTSDQKCKRAKWEKKTIGNDIKYIDCERAEEESNTSTVSIVDL